MRDGLRVGADADEPPVAVSELANEFERRARQYELAVDDLEGRDLDDLEHSREFFDGKRDAYDEAAEELHDLADELEVPS